MSHKNLSKIAVYMRNHKVATVLGFVIVLGVGYWTYKKMTDTSGEPRYVLASAKKETIITSITASGQVSASNQVDIKPKTSGDVVYIGVANGQEVAAGKLIAQLDARDAERAVRDAEISLASAKLSLQKLQKPADNLSIIQSENTLERAKQSKQTAEDNLKKAYDDGYNNVSNAFLDLPTVMAGLQNTLYTYSTGSGAQWNIDFYADAALQYSDKARQFKEDTDAKYQTARKAYDTTFEKYKSVTRSSDTTTIESLINESYETVKNIADAIKSANNLIQFYQDKLIEHNVTPISLSTTHLSSLNTYTGKTNTQLLNLLDAKNSIKSNRDTIINSERTILENTESLAKLKSGADSLDIESSQLSVKQRENSLLDAQENLDKYFIRAPLSGTIAKLNVKKADSVSAGTAVATLVTHQKIAELSLNEIDAAKIKIGQKATLTFDAIEGLDISGSVAEIDTVGTVTQGVVTYNVKISFDTQDDRIKAGMSTSAAIILDIKQDVLSVPNSAVKTQDNMHYVELFDTPLPQSQTASVSQGVASPSAPRQQVVEIGVSNDSTTEIISGLSDGQQIVSRTITAKTNTTPAAPSLFGSGGGARGGGGNVRIGR